MAVICIGNAIKRSASERMTPGGGKTFSWTLADDNLYVIGLFPLSFLAASADRNGDGDFGRVLRGLVRIWCWGRV